MPETTRTGTTSATSDGRLAGVDNFRRFSRYFTQRIGLLTDHYLGQDRPLGQARLLFEIGPGASVRELRTRLGLDAGYLSRMLRALEDQGMIRMSVHPQDNRIRLAERTPAGDREVSEQNRRADAVAEDLLARLTEHQRAELDAAVTRAERLLRLASITVEPVDPASADARHCLAAFADELKVRFPEGFDEAGGLIAPDELSGATGAFLVAYDGTRPIGCGAVRTLEPGVGELRHVWVDAGTRGLGLGRRLLDGLERQALSRGLTVVRLGTHRVLTEAIAMYHACGYAEIPAYERDSHAHHWFERHLRA